ncbi:hypothetical protein M2390_002929 [Mycetocola sp. BIGb0189]|uniref:DUF6093 family protein n=1 Tax=Mycetocola sp. BIGb0189 TaxID=2940604 RepID=UPI00216AB1AB|nr:DUF6093 family protein [Mycetocola sp. BIGb0189]MCS4277720.1 hypothetical protein [Mycetocola sp. BIGb0189]
MAQREAEAGMHDTCVIGFETHSTVLDEATGEYPLVISTPVYEGACQVMNAGGTARVVAGGQVEADQGTLLKLPVKAVGVRTDMIVRILTAGFDPDLPGTIYRVLGPAKKTYAATRRFRVEEKV